VSSSSFSRDEVRAAAETHRELGPDYQDAVIESFLDKVGKEIDARVDARVGEGRRGWVRPAAPPKDRQGIFLAITSMVLGIPLTAIVMGVGTTTTGLVGLIIVWVAIVAINVTHAVRYRPPQSR
jgi:hypothetical protein